MLGLHCLISISIKCFNGFCCQMEKTKLFYMMEIHSCCQMDIYLCCQTEIFLLPDGNIFILVSRWIAPDWSLRVAISSDHSAWGERAFLLAILVLSSKNWRNRNSIYDTKQLDFFMRYFLRIQVKYDWNSLLAEFRTKYNSYREKVLCGIFSRTRSSSEGSLKSLIDVNPTHNSTFQPKNPFLLRKDWNEFLNCRSDKFLVQTALHVDLF